MGLSFNGGLRAWASNTTQLLGFGINKKSSKGFQSPQVQQAQASIDITLKKIIKPAWQPRLVSAIVWKALGLGCIKIELQAFSMGFKAQALEPPSPGLNFAQHYCRYVKPVSSFACFERHSFFSLAS